MRVPLALAALTGALLPIGAEAAACTYAIVGDSRSPSERRAEESRRSRDLVQERRKRARSALSAGADAGTALAEMLVPNVRPVFGLYGGCPMEGQDQGAGRETADDWLAGTRYSGRLEEFV
jgi:hypothetical protein